MIGKFIFAAGLLVAGTVAAQAGVLEDFETGGFGPARTIIGGSSTVSGAGAFEGAFGVASGDGAWAMLIAGSTFRRPGPRRSRGGAFSLHR